MPRKPIELPPAVAREFLADKHALFVEKNKIRADAIARANCTRSGSTTRASCG
jgi:hypothetical protein